MDFELTNDLREAMYAHAGCEQPRECCGLIVRRADTGLVEYFPSINVHPFAGEDRFRVDPQGYAQCADDGEILAVVHSHPNASANPSMADRVGCERSGLPWLVIGWPSGVVKSLEPQGWVAPFVGREFCHGVLDCYTLIQDWFWRELQLELPDFDREDDWWTKGQDLYMANFERAGFVRVAGMPQRHDVMLMQVCSKVANHGAVYLGSGVMLHHLYDRLSEETVYQGGYYERHTLALLRHKSLVDAAAVLFKAAA